MSYIFRCCTLLAVLPLLCGAPGTSSATEPLATGLASRPLTPAGLISQLRSPVDGSVGNLQLEQPRPYLLQGNSGEAMTRPSGESAEAIARRFVREKIAPPGDLRLESVILGGGGVRFVRLQQEFASIPVYGGRIDIAVTKDGAVLAARVGKLAPAGPDTRFLAITNLSAHWARLHALQVTGWRPGPTSPAEDGAPLEKQVLLPTALGAEPVWQLQITDADRPEIKKQVFVSRVDGKVKLQEDVTFHAVTAGRVITQDPDAGDAWLAFPEGVSVLSVHSPVGWSYDSNISQGNNVQVELDREADFFATPGQLAAGTGDPSVFDFSFTGDPAVDVDAALANVFWVLNNAHDRFGTLGLDPPSGAFQEDNYQRGGAAGDRIYALVQYDGRDGTYPYNNLVSSAGADGTFSWMVVGLFETPEGEIRDAAFEPDVLYHEYAHMVAARMLGDASCLTGVQPAGLGEGWGDFYGASFTDDPVIGAWLADESSSGLRRSSLDTSTFTYFNLCFDGCNANNDGEIWSGALWDLRREMIARYGQEDGRYRAEQLVFEGMRYTPCQPTFLQARDGILLADTALHGGEDRCSIWTAFSRRGMGASATSAGPGDNSPQAAVDFPVECAGGASISWDQPEYGVEAAAVIEVFDAAGDGSPISVDVSSLSGDQILVQAFQVGAGPLYRATVPLSVTDGGASVLLVADGDVLDASVSSLGVDAQVGVTGTFPLVIGSHTTYGTCQEGGVEDDMVPGFYNLPGFLDAGEQIELTVTLGHGALTELEDVSVNVVSLNPDVVVLPSAPMQLGTIRRAPGAGMGRAFQLNLRAQADPGVQFGDTADLVFTVRARGRVAQTVLQLQLNRDYELRNALSPFDGGVETFEASSSTAGAWTHQACLGVEDSWTLESCAGNGGGAGYQNGISGCWPYEWGQVASYLLSPSIFVFPPDAVAIILGDFSWENDVSMWTEPTSPYCDADAVAIYSTNDPATLPCADAPNLFNYNPQRAYLWPDNTNGYELSGPYGVDRSPILLDPNVDYSVTRLAWLFYGDIFDCLDTNANEGWYRLDNVRITYDLVITVPERAPCTLACALRTEISAQESTTCPGAAMEINASGTESVGCPSQIRYGFAGTGVPAAYGWTYENIAPALGEDGMIYSVYAQCEDIPDCNDYQQFTNRSPALPGMGGTILDSLRMGKTQTELIAQYEGAAAPDSFGVYSVDDASRLIEDLSTWTLSGSGTGTGLQGEGEIRFPIGSSTTSLTFYQVVARDPCTNAPRLP